MMSLSAYESAVLQELHEKLDESQYDKIIESRLSIVSVMIMDQYSRPWMDRPSPKELAGMIIGEFSAEQ